MAEKNKTETLKIESDNNEPKKDKSENVDVKKEGKNNNTSLTWILGGLAVFIFICLFVSSFGMFAYNHNNKNINQRFYDMPMMEGRERGFRQRGGMMFRDDNISSNNQAVISGVVTAVSGDTFTVAGGGTTNTVKTTSSTTYTGATKANINDTVNIVGNTSNGVFTATRVIVRN